MAYIVLPSRWSRQPSGAPVAPDPRFDLALLWSPSIRIDVVSGLQAQPQNAGYFVHDARYGRSRSNRTEDYANYGVRFERPGRVRPSTDVNGFSFLFLTRWIATTFTETPELLYFDSAGGVGIGTGGNSGRLFFASGPGRAYSTAAITSGSVNILGFSHRYNDASGRRFYINGVRDASTPTTVGDYSFANHGSYLSVGGVPGNGAYRGDIWLAAIANRIWTDAEFAELARNPWQLFRPLPRRVYYSLASAGVTISTTPIAATASGVAANIAVNVTLSTTPVTATASGVQAAVSQNETVSTTPVTATASGVAAAIAQNETVGTTPVTATASGVQAAIQASTTVETAPIAATASGVQAAVSTATNVTVETTPIAATASGVQATLTLNARIDTWVATAFASGSAANIAQNETVGTTPVAATASGIQAHVATNQTTATSAVAAAASGVQARVSQNETLGTQPVSATASGVQARVSTNVTVSTSPVQATASGVPMLVSEIVVGAPVAASASGVQAAVLLITPQLDTTPVPAYASGVRAAITGGGSGIDGIAIGSNLAVGERLEVGGDLVIWEQLSSNSEVAA